MPHLKGLWCLRELVASQPATCQRSTVKLAHVWAIRDGKVAAFQQHVDTAKVRDLN